MVPAAQLSGLRGDADGLGEEDEMPHARGPEEIGMEDMGPQASVSGSERGGPGIGMQGIDVEAAVGRRAEPAPSEDVKEEGIEKAKDEEDAPRTPKRGAEEELGADEKRFKDEEHKDMKVKEEEMEMVDADGKTEDENKIGEGGENVGADAVDATTL